jgi:hypothetical protein
MRVWVGYDAREQAAFGVACRSIRRHCSPSVGIVGLYLSLLRHVGLYTRPTERRDGRMWDLISGAPMATAFAISRFLVPHIARSGLALFVDADVMARVDIGELLAQADPKKACMVVKHNHLPTNTTKMDGQAQTAYARKNWSSVVLWNCDHPGTRALTPDVVNRERGLWLHQFTWLDDEDIGELEPGWNHLVGDMPPNPDAKIVHFTNGTPDMPGYEDCEFADEWRNELKLKS